MGDESDPDEYVWYGTALVDQAEASRLPHWQATAASKDAGAVRNLPVWKQEVTDEEGRKRFHGAFTGGFSAGFYNTVGSLEGFQPAAFKSSRDARAARKEQDLDAFLDEDEKQERNKTALLVKDDYDTFGSTAQQKAAAAAQKEADARPSLIPGPIISELITPVGDGIGMRLLQRMGWRPGRGVGSAPVTREGQEGSRWGTVAGVSMENTPIYVLEPKQDVHGLGYDPFEDAEEFRQRKRQKADTSVATGGNGSTASVAAGGRGGGGGARGGPAAGRVAFGTGVLEDTDTLGYMEDYVDEQDGVETAGFARLGGGTGNGASKGAVKAGLGGNTRLLTFNFELQSDESDDEDRFVARKKKEGLRLEAAAPQAMLLGKQHLVKEGAFIPGFMPADIAVTSAFYPAPSVPADFVERHIFRSPLLTQQQDDAPVPVPEAPPPSNPLLRREADSLASQVARSGSVVEALARKQAAASPAASFQFLVTGGEVAAYYAYRLYKIRAALCSVVQANTRQSAAPAAQLQQRSQSSVPLTLERRMQLLGETPLPSSRPTPETSMAASAVAAAASLSGHDGPSRQQLRGEGAVAVQVAEGDRQRLQDQLAGSFVKASVQEMDLAGKPPVQYGLQHRKQLVPAATAAAASAAFSSRFTSGSSIATATLQPDTNSAGLQAAPRAAAAAEAASVAAQVAAEKAKYRPIHSSEEWRPEALLCRRFNVPDPYANKPVAPIMSKFKSDYVALPDTAAAAAAAAAATGAAASVEQPTVTASSSSFSIPPRMSLPPPPSVSDAVPYPPPPPAQPKSSSRWSTPSDGGLVPLPPPPPRTSSHQPSRITDLNSGAVPAAFHSQPAQQLPPPPPIFAHTSAVLSANQAAPQDAKSMAAQFLQSLGSTLFASDQGTSSTQSLPPPPNALIALGQTLTPLNNVQDHKVHSRTAAEGLTNQAAAPVLPEPSASQVVHTSAGEAIASEATVDADAAEAVAELHKPLDLFRAIFNDASDDEDEEDEDEADQHTAANAQARRNDQPVADAPLNSHAAGQKVLSRPQGLAEALMRAQEVSAAKATEAREASNAAAAARAAMTGAAGVTYAGADVVDPAVQERILQALAVLKHSSAKSKKSKDKERGKDRSKRKDRGLDKGVGDGKSRGKAPKQRGKRAREKSVTEHGKSGKSKRRREEEDRGDVGHRKSKKLKESTRMSGRTGQDERLPSGHPVDGVRLKERSRRSDSDASTSTSSGSSDVD